MAQDYILIGGGCFWGMEQLFAERPGIVDTEVGYAGGTADSAHYRAVCKGNTGHAETLKLLYDSQLTSLAEIFRFFFRIHDPTQLNRQGNDRGTQYRSVIFYRTEEQKQVAEQVIQEVNDSGRWPKPVVTQIEKESPFYTAEDYHQDYLKKNPGGYTCHYIRK